MKFYIHVIVLSIFVSTSSEAQVSFFEEDFEENETIMTWLGDDCNLDLNYINPYKQSDNTSDKVLEYNDVGGQYANVRFETSETFDLSTNHTFSLKIYMPSNGLTGNQATKVSLKLQDGRIAEPWTTQCEIIKSLSVDQWQTVTFDFKNDNYINLNSSSLPPTARYDFNRVVIQLNGENNNDNVLAYIDDVSYVETITNDPVFDYLVWSDEFDENGAINGDYWFHQTQLPEGGSWFNGEIQHYTDRLENAFVENGLLKIVAQKETFTDQGETKQYTSARLNSKFAMTYGRVEVRAKLPTGFGTWPAIWMLGKNINEDGAYWDNQGFDTTPWPACGEIDIMEHWGYNQNFVQSAMHTPSSFGNTFNHGGQYIPTASSAFHTYALEWSPDKMVFSVDGVVHYTYNPEVKDANTWPFNQDQYLILNIAIQPSIAPSFISSAMEIDFIRVYQESPLAITEIQQNEVVEAYPVPFSNELTIKLKDVSDQKTVLNFYSVDGELVGTFRAEVSNSIIKVNDLDALRNGWYLVNFEVDGQRFKEKVIKK